MDNPRTHSLTLFGCVLLLLALCWTSIEAPRRFAKEVAHRETAVKSRLNLIRIAEEQYKDVHGVYAAQLTTLVQNKLLADSLRFIPYAQHQTFQLATATLQGKSGKSIPVMECRAAYKSFLYDLDRMAVERLVQQCMETGRYPGLKIGDLTQPNGNAGNWE